MGRKQQPLVSLLNLDDFEENRIINTPRSLEACRSEGIDPEELLYIPPEVFYQPHLSPRLQQLHFEFFEAKRKEVLAIVKRARLQMTEGDRESVRKSGSTGSLKSHQKLFGSVVEHAKEKHEKMIGRMLNYEALATEKLQERLEEEAKKAQKEAKEAKRRLKEERRIAETRRIMEIERLEQAREEEKLAKKNALKQFQKDVEEAMKRQAAEEAEAKARAKRAAKNEAKRMRHLQRMEENLITQQMQKEQKLQAKLASEEERQLKLEENKEKAKRRLRKLSRIREEKRQRVIENIEAQIATKRQEFERVQSIIQQKHSRYMEEQMQSIERLKSISVERDMKIKKTREIAEQILEERRKLILQKASENDLKVKKQRELLASNIEFKKHEEMLRGLKKEWNVRRARRKEEYLKEMAEKKMKDDEKRIRRFLMDRDNMIQQRQEFNTQHMLQKYEIKQALHRMAVTKKWDSDLLKSVSQDDRSVKTATSHQARLVTSQSKTKINREKSPKEEAPPPFTSPI